MVCISVDVNTVRFVKMFRDGKRIEVPRTTDWTEQPVFFFFVFVVISFDFEFIVFLIDDFVFDFCD